MKKLFSVDSIMILVFYLITNCHIDAMCLLQEQQNEEIERIFQETKALANRMGAIPKLGAQNILWSAISPLVITTAQDVEGYKDNESFIAHLKYHLSVTIILDLRASSPQSVDQKRENICKPEKLSGYGHEIALYSYACHTIRDVQNYVRTVFFALQCAAQKRERMVIILPSNGISFASCLFQSIILQLLIESSKNFWAQVQKQSEISIEDRVITPQQAISWFYDRTDRLVEQEFLIDFPWLPCQRPFGDDEVSEQDREIVSRFFG